MIDKEDKIVYIDAKSDGEALRVLTIHLASGKKQTFGEFEGELKDSFRYDFAAKQDVLGAYAVVNNNPKDETDTLI